MKVDLSCNCTKPQQNFGMAFHSNETVDKVLIKRIKTVADTEKLNKIFNKQKMNNKVDIILFADNNDRLSANIYAKALDGDWQLNLFKQYSENFFSKLFQGPVGFIEKMANIADKEAAKLSKKEQIANNIKSIQ